jgi:hypothetical protein
MDALTVADWLYHDILVNYGAPKVIITDRGSNFLADVMQDFLREQHIRHKTSTPYHPQTNGMVERMHAPLVAAISRLAEFDPTRWDEFLPAAVFALRTRTHSVTGFKPFYLVYGTDPVLPGDINPPAMVEMDEMERQEALGEHTARELEALGDARAAAHHRSRAQAIRMQRDYNARRGVDEDEWDMTQEQPGNRYSIGEMVKLKTRGGRATKFEQRWTGPYTITAIGPSPHTYFIMDPNGAWSRTLIAQDNLAPWIDTTPDTSDTDEDDTDGGDTEVSESLRQVGENVRLEVIEARDRTRCLDHGDQQDQRRLSRRHGKREATTRVPSQETLGGGGTGCGGTTARGLGMVIRKAT